MEMVIKKHIMKRSIIILAGLFLAITANAQTMETTIKNLVEQELISKNQVRHYKVILSDFDHEGPSAHLQALFALELEEFTGPKSFHLANPVYLTFGDKMPDEREQAQINVGLVDYLSRLNAAGLIDERQLEFFRNEVEEGTFVHILQLAPEIMTKIEIDEMLAPENFDVIAEELLQDSICTGNNNERLKADIAQYKLNNPIDILEYCDKAVVVREEDYPEEPENYLEAIHEKTAKVLDELDFEDFQFKIVLDSSISREDSKFYDFVISLKVKGKEYSQRSSYHLYSPSKNKYFGNKIDQQSYYKIFNKVLADNQSPYRLHEVKSFKANAVNWEVFGIIALTSEQATTLHGYWDFLRPSYESFKNTLTTDRIEIAIREYRRLGLFDHLSEVEINNGIQSVREQENSNLNDVLMCFPRVVYAFDMELGNLETPYVELVEEFSKISHGQFKPENIWGNFDFDSEEKCTIRFDLNGKTFSKDLVVDSDWMDVNFFGFVDTVVAESGLDGKFHSLFEGGQGAIIIYLTPKQYSYLREYKLAVFPDQWGYQE